MEELLKQLYDDKVINYRQYINLLTALDKRVRTAMKTGILQVINKIKPLPCLQTLRQGFSVPIYIPHGIREYIPDNKDVSKLYHRYSGCGSQSLEWRNCTELN